MIEWKSEYEVNVPIVDQQHERLFEIAASAEQLLLLPNSVDKYDDIVAIIDSLKDYLVFHFDSEQKILEQIKYPKYLSHRVSHNDFVEKFNGIDLEKIDNRQQQNLSEILSFVMVWITEHVLGDDREWAKHYSEVIKK